MWPLALMTKPVPLLPALPDLGLLGAFAASFFAATAFGAVNSPALLIPPALIVVKQLDSAPSSGPVDVRLKFNTVWPDTATIRLAFWNVRATFGGRTAVA